MNCKIHYKYIVIYIPIDISFFKVDEKNLKNLLFKKGAFVP